MKKANKSGAKFKDIPVIQRSQVPLTESQGQQNGFVKGTVKAVTVVIRLWCAV